MVPESALAVLFVGFVGAGLLAFFVLRMASALDLLAHPNERSSHAQATPSIGGIAICIPLFIYLASVAGQFQAVWALLAACVVLALVGLIDDLRDLRPSVRLAAQGLAVIMALGTLFADLHWAWWPLLLLAFLWHINLFNFMDGIDGLAASQALFYALAAMLLAPGLLPWVGYLLCVLAGTLVGFLVYNWPPARMFMGDVGSTVLGLLLAVVGALLWQASHLSGFATLVLLSVFWFDASYTLCVRMLTGQRFTQPHRSHLYQRLADQLGHARTTLGFWLFALVWLLPLAYFAQQQRSALGLLALVLAIAPQAVLAIKMRAGRAVAQANGEA